MKVSRDEVLERLRKADPVVREDVVGAVDSEEARRLLDSVVATPRVAARRTRRTRRVWIPSLVSGVALIAAIALVLSQGGTPSPRPAILTLEDVARVAAAVDPQPVDGRYRYTRSRDGYLSSVSFATESGDAASGMATAFVPSEREIWIAPDGSGRLKTVSGEPRFFGPKDRERWIEMGKPSFGGNRTEDDTFEAGELFYEDFSGLPDDVDALYEEIERRSQEGPDGVRAEMFDVIAGLLRETVAPAELRANLYRVIDRIPGVTLQSATDEAGRRGVSAAIEYRHAGRFLKEIVFDPETSEVLGEREKLLEEVSWLDAPTGTVIGYSINLDDGFVDSVRDRPESG
jgi:hypothetical protein